MGIFKKAPVKRLTEAELRSNYVESKRIEKLTTLFFMFISTVISIAIISFSISQKIYWVLVFSILSILWFIHLITKLSVIIEEVFENREEEDE